MSVQIYLLNDGKITWCRDYQLLAYHELMKSTTNMLDYDKNGYKFKLLLDKYFNIAILIKEDRSIGGYIGLYDSILTYLEHKVSLSVNFKDLLDKNTGLYVYNFLSGENKELVLSIVDNPIELNYLVDNTFVFRSPKFNDEDVQEHLSNRIPAYYGKTMKQFYREERFMELLDGDTDKRLVKLDSRESPIYTVCGPMMTPGIKNDFCAVHSWGLNFESKETLDYRTYISDCGSKLKNKDILRQRMEEMLKCIFKASDYFHKGKYHELRIPYIGLGCYLSGINSNEIRDELKKLFFTLLKDITNKYTNMSVVICNPDQSYNNEILKIENSYENNNYFNFQTNLFELSPVRTTWVNAWDTHSFIGNGGSFDNSIDGWFVSGTNINTKYNNASYLHNIILFSNDKKIISY